MTEPVRRHQPHNLRVPSCLLVPKGALEDVAHFFMQTVRNTDREIMFPHLPEELTTKIVSSVKDCRTIVQACTAIGKAGCDSAVWADAARKLDVSARNVYKEYTDKPQENTFWSSEKIRSSLFSERHPTMTKTEFIKLCKYATQRTKLLAHMRSLREWMTVDGWKQIDAKAVKIPIVCVAFEFHSMKRMSRNGVKIALRIYRTGDVAMTYQRNYTSGGESTFEWYPVNSDERVYSLMSAFDAVKHFAHSPHLNGQAEWHGTERTWKVTIKPP